MALVLLLLTAAACDVSDDNQGVGASPPVGIISDHPFCLNDGCHASSVEFDSNPDVRSQRDWQTEHGGGEGRWTKRGVHDSDPAEEFEDPATASCYLCHAPTCDNCHANGRVHADGPEPPTYPVSRSGEPLAEPTDPNCGTSCHVWVKEGETVAATGFVNASGDPAQTTYAGPVSPAELLEDAATETPSHAGIHEGSGCAGFCHGGPSAAHGSITECTSCHNFVPGTTGNLHATHLSMVVNERSSADPENAGREPCDYCHAGAGAGELYRASCWACHLSGHNPATPYWQPAAE